MLIKESHADVQTTANGKESTMRTSSPNISSRIPSYRWNPESQN